jgi:hypothetical protein
MDGHLIPRVSVPAYTFHFSKVQDEQQATEYLYGYYGASHYIQDVLIDPNAAAASHSLIGLIAVSGLA